MSQAVHYFSGRKNPHHAAAMAAGWQARTVPIEQARMEAGAALHICGGLQFGGLEILQAVRRSGQPYVFLDRAYFGGGPRSGRLRATFGAYQKNWIDEQPADRLQRLKITPQPWRQAGEHILLVPPSDAIARLFSLAPNWLENLLAKLRALTDRKIDVSVKGDPRPLEQRFERCHCVVTWTSNVAVEAVVAGVPAIVAAESAARPVAGHLQELFSGLGARDALEHPPTPAREAWLRSLAYGQFELEEIRNGCARAILSGGFK